MRFYFKWILLIAGLLAAPAALFAQEGNTYEVPQALFTGPFSHPRYEDGGFYTGLEFLYGRTNRQLATQPIAYRGVLDSLGNITGFPGAFTILPGAPIIGGPANWGAPALTTGQVAGSGVSQPGYNIFIGYRFQGGVDVELSWKHYQPANYQAFAGPIPPGLNTYTVLQTFLTSPVTGFSTDWAGNDVNVAGYPIGSTFGIWNGASSMKITLTQAIDIYQINVRVPIWDTDNYRTYGLIGPRAVTLQDKFAWYTVDADTNGNFTPDTTATYTNTVTNNMYGVHFGFGHEWFLGATPAGSFAFNFEFEGAVYADIVKGSFNWDRGDDLVSIGRVVNRASLVPGVEARIGLTWYPWEAIQIHLGYEVTTFFNTMASRNPIDFNMGSNNPELNNVFFRWVYGLNFGVTFTF